MSRVDQFESIFRSATKEVYQYQDIGMEKLLVVTDKNQTDSEQFSSIIKKFLHALTTKHELSWELLNGDDFTTSADLLDRVESMERVMSAVASRQLAKGRPY